MDQSTLQAGVIAFSDAILVFQRRVAQEVALLTVGLAPVTREVADVLRCDVEQSFPMLWAHYTRLCLRSDRVYSYRDDWSGEPDEPAIEDLTIGVGGHGNVAESCEDWDDFWCLGEYDPSG